MLSLDKRKVFFSFSLVTFNLFQLSASFCQCPNIPDTYLGDEMHNSPLKLGRKRAELNVCESFKYFTRELLRKYLEKICVTLKVQFHHEGGLSESRYFELFFSTRYEAPPHKKSTFTEPPFLLFLTFGLISSNFAAIFWVKNMGHDLVKAT